MWINCSEGWAAKNIFYLLLWAVIPFKVTSLYRYFGTFVDRCRPLPPVRCQARQICCIACFVEQAVEQRRVCSIVENIVVVAVVRVVVTSASLIIRLLAVVEVVSVDRLLGWFVVRWSPRRVSWVWYVARFRARATASAPSSPSPSSTASCSNRVARVENE